MADASNLQTDFRGGEWSQAAQGRIDDKEYKRALNSCFNAYPTEAGQWVRRQGTRWLAYTLSGLFAWLIEFAFSQNAPYEMEITGTDVGGGIRFFAGSTLVMTNDVQPVVSISGANPAVLTTAAAVTWATGDQVNFLVANGVDTSGCGVILNRQFALTKLTTTTFSLEDAVTQVTLDGSTFTAPTTGLSVGRILKLASPYNQIDLPNVRSVQTEQLSNNILFGNVVLLNPLYAPQVVANTTLENSAAFAQFAVNPAVFLDGPYIDPVGGSVSSNATSGVITLSSAPANTFASTDVGRAVRLFSEPPNWASGTAYVMGNAVKFTDGNYYTATANSTGKSPDQNPTLWAITPAAATWAWGTITSFVSGTSVTVTLPALWPDGVTKNALLYTGTINTWRLGVYSATTSYPACGIFHEGRLWLGGAVGNRFDGSASNQPFVFSPTAPDGTVGDANGISYLFNSDDVNQILWMNQEHQGMIAGTLGGEWLIQASSLGDPLTPTSIQAHRVSKYKCANTPAVRTPLSNVFVQANQRRVVEYLADIFSQRYLGRNLSEKALHLTTSGVMQLAYQQDLAPIVWTRKADGSFSGMTYKRESSFTSEPPTFAGWHRHQLGLPGAQVTSIATGPNVDGTLESLFMVVLDPRTGFYHVEQLTDMFEETTPIEKAWFLDSALAATAVKTNSTGAVIFGFTPYIGQKITVWGAGLDLGDYTVASDGSITLTYGTPPLFTQAYLQTYSSANPISPWDTRILLNATVTYSSSTPENIQSYAVGSPVTANPTGGFVNDRDNNRVATFAAGNGSTDGITTYNRLTGAQTGAVTATALFAGVPNASSNAVTDGSGLAIDVSGNVFFASDLSNSTCIRKVNLGTLTITGSFGTPGSGIGQATSSTIFNTRSLASAPIWVPPKKNSPRDNMWTNLLFATALLGDWWAILNSDNMTLLSNGTVSEARSNCCSGQVFANNTNATSYTNFHMIGMANSGSLGPLGVYTVSVLGADKHLTNSPTFTRTGQITATAIDGTWTNIDGVVGPIFDETDGNLFLGVSTTDAVATQSYIIKINPATAAIVWKTASASIGIGSSLSKVQYGTLTWMDGNHTVYSITTAGVLTTVSLTGCSQLGISALAVSDDYDGALFVKLSSYTSGGGAPVPLNNTPASFSNTWVRLQGSGITTQQTAASAIFNLPSVPFIGGYTYTSQGQRVRPAEPADSGARNGPGFAKTRRNFKAGFQLAQAQGISIGTQFVDTTKIRTLVLKSDRVNVNPLNELFTGVARQEVDDDNTFDGMLAWEIIRPYPCIVTAVGGFLHTQDI